MSIPLEDNIQTDENPSEILDNNICQDELLNLRRYAEQLFGGREYLINSLIRFDMSVIENKNEDIPLN